MSTPEKLPAVYCAADTTDIEKALGLAAAMQKAGCGLKIGLEFFNANGPAGIQEIKKSYEELSIFLDLKYHDIPNTVAGAMRAVAPLGVDFVNVHASGGHDMMLIAADTIRNEAERTGNPIPKVLGVTILTSIDEQALTEIGYVPPLEDRVTALAKLAKKAGLDGVVCSAREIELIRAECGDSFSLMVPGIRPAGSDAGDQKRIMTPEEAMRKGASHLVIGRPITKAENPADVASSILQTIAA